jgi:hypothetical protein
MIKTFFILATLLFNPPIEVEERKWDVPYECDSYWVDKTKNGEKRRKIRAKPYTAEERKRFRKIIHVVAREMGADPRIFKLWAKREGNLYTSSIHIKDEDIRANKMAWMRHEYHPEMETYLEMMLEDHPPVRREHWKYRAKMADIQMYKGNPFFYNHFIVNYANGFMEEMRQVSSWWRGYGPFGFNGIYYTHVWDKEAPPWIFCSYDGVPAIITAIWAARKQMHKCTSQGYSQTYGTLDRIFSSGHCSDSYSKDFVRRARSWGINPDAKPRLGRKWKRSETDRNEILNHMLSKLREKELIE